MAPTNAKPKQTFKAGRAENLRSVIIFVPLSFFWFLGRIVHPPRPNQNALQLEYYQTPDSLASHFVAYSINSRRVMVPVLFGARPTRVFASAASISDGRQT